MIGFCPFWTFWWSAIFLGNISLPDFSYNIGFSTVKNLSCRKIEIGSATGTLNSTIWALKTLQPSNVSCTMHVDSGIFESSVVGNVSLLPSDFALRKESGEQCGRTNVSVVSKECNLNLRINQLRLEPPNPFLDFVLLIVQGLIESESRRLVCNDGLAYIEKEFLNRSANALKPVPFLSPHSTPMSTSPLFRGVQNVVNNLPQILGLKLSASIINETTIRLVIQFVNGFHFALGEKSLIYDGIHPLFPEIPSTLPVILQLINQSGLPLILPQGGGTEMTMRQSFEASIDVSFHDLLCCTSGTICNVPRQSGITVQNIRTNNFGEWDRIVANHVDPLLSSLLDQFIQEMINKSATKDSDEYLYISLKQKRIHNVPPTVLWVLLFVGGLIILGVVIFFSVWRHRRSPVMGMDKTPISLQRVIVEDTILVLMSVLSIFLFAWSNGTDAATLEIGGELRLLTFSLMETTRSLYEAGLKPLAILVFLFSGIYPYLKILAILVWTLVLQKPSSTILKLVDYFGKFSFLDSFAMVIMASGLQVAGIAEVKILPGFYVFLSATILSVLTGNYATTLWRRNTSLRQLCDAHEPTIRDVDNPYEVVSTEETSMEPAKNEFCLSKRRVLLASLNGLFVACCVIPAWFVPCLRYRTKGMASVIQTNDRNMTLYDVSSISVVLVITCIVTLVIAPILFAVMYPNLSLLASWGAVDIFLIACVCVVFQIGQFVQFYIGKNSEELYYPEIHMLWPLIPLLFCALWQWMLVMESLFNYTLFLKTLLNRIKALRN